MSPRCARDVYKRQPLTEAFETGCPASDAQGVAEWRRCQVEDVYKRQLLDFQAGLGDAGGVREGEVVPRLERRTADHFDLALPFPVL